MGSIAEMGRELWFVGPHHVEVRACDAKAPGAGQVRARALSSGVSQGTELLLYGGEGPTPFDPSLSEADAPMYPRRYGYSWVGEITGVGPDVQSVAVGARVFALAPHADAHVFREGEVRLMDGAIPPERAVLAASLETAINCVWDSGASLGDSAVVIGGGVIGLLIARLACSAGATVRLVEPSPRRRSAGRALGVSCVAPGEDDPRADADVVFEATGHPSVLDRAIAHAGFEATVVVASFYGARTAPVSLGGDFHRRRLILRSSQVSAIPPARAPRWSAARRFGLVQQLLRDPAWDAVLDPPVPFDAAPATYASLERAPGDALQTVFVYR